MIEKINYKKKENEILLVKTITKKGKITSVERTHAGWVGDNNFEIEEGKKKQYDMSVNGKGELIKELVSEKDYIKPKTTEEQILDRLTAIEEKLNL